MKKIINGKMYNTETAKNVGFRSNNKTRMDFGFVEETLYLKRTGEFFLHGFGGAATVYAERCDNNAMCEGEKIVPMTEEEAMQWSEEYLDADEYEAIFGEVAE